MDKRHKIILGFIAAYVLGWFSCEYAFLSASKEVAREFAFAATVHIQDAIK